MRRYIEEFSNRVALTIKENDKTHIIHVEQGDRLKNTLAKTPE